MSVDDQWLQIEVAIVAPKGRAGGGRRQADSRQTGNGRAFAYLATGPSSNSRHLLGAVSDAGPLLAGRCSNAQPVFTGAAVACTGCPGSVSTSIGSKCYAVAAGADAFGGFEN